MDTNDAVIAVRLPTEMKDSIESAAQREHRSTAGLIRLLISRHLEHGPQADGASSSDGDGRTLGVAA